MATPKPIFFRPIEITPSNNSFTVTLHDGGHTFHLDNGVWGSIFNVAAGIASEIEAGTSWYCSAYIVQDDVDDWDIRIKFTLADPGMNGVAPSYTWNEVYDIIGSASASAGNYDDDADLGSGVYTVTMTYRPQYVWVPRYQNANQERFYIKHNDRFYGSMSQTGYIAGNIPPGKIYWRDLMFVNEPAENLYVEAATDLRMATRNLEHFADGCRTSYPAEAGNPSTRGFYFIPDWNDIIALCSEEHTDEGGIQFDYSSSPDEYVFCQMDIGGISMPTPSVPTTRDRYTAGMTIHTVSYTPTWTYYTA